MRGRAAYFSACHHQPKMLWLDVLARLFQTMAHRHVEADFVAIETIFNATYHPLSHGILSHGILSHGISLRTLTIGVT